LLDFNAKTPRRRDAKKTAESVLVMLMVCLLALPGVAASADEPAIDPALLEQLEALDQKAAEIEDTTSGFEQRRYSPLLRKPIESVGTVRSVAGTSRWDTQEPYASVMLIEAGRLSLYDPEQKLLEVYPLERRLTDLAASPIPRLPTWRDHFVIAAVSEESLSDAMRGFVAKVREVEPERGVLLVSLRPRADDLAEQVAWIYAVIDERTGLSRGIAWGGDADSGERTEIVFRDSRINTGLEREGLLIDLPEDARVVYPLGPVEAVDEGAGGADDQ
jgi:outer membrane lipoprotein-sorting protein